MERTVWYTYYTTGHVGHVTIRDEGYPGNGTWLIKDLYLVYAGNESLNFAVWEEWLYDPTIHPNPLYPSARAQVTVTDAWEFRYDTGRRRYLTRVWDPQNSTTLSNWVAGETFWTDYLGDEPYGQGCFADINPFVTLLSTNARLMDCP